MIKVVSTHAITLVVALLVGVWVGHEWEEVKHTHHDLRVSAYANGSLTNPLLECGVETDEITIGQRAQIEKTVLTFVEQSKQLGMIRRTSVYFRDLNNGPWFGIDEREPYTPGSMLKLPIAITLYWWEQRQPGVLDKTIDFKGFFTRPADTGSYGMENALDPGVYSVRDLTGIMLKKSSNDAAQVLSDYVGYQREEKIFSDLGITPPSEAGAYTIDVKTFGAFFRVLFNASYLGQPASEALLTTLTQTEFRDGLVAGVPPGVTVAHKFGTRVIDGSRQLHDCGIVYAGRAPYVLCVMTQGSSIRNLEYVIAGISKRVYEGVTQ